MDHSFAEKNKVLYVIHGYPPHNHAGTENYSYSLANEVSKNKFNVAAFYPVIFKNLTNPKLYIKKIKNYTAFEVRTKPFNHINNLFNSEIEDIFLQVIKSFNPDIIHFQHIHTVLPFSLLAQSISLKIPTLITLHDFWYICPRTYMLNKDGTLCSGPTSSEKCAQCFLKNEYLAGIDNKKIFYYLVDLFTKRLELSRLIFLNANLASAPSKYLLDKYKEYLTFNKSARLPLGLDIARQNLIKKINRPIRFGFLGNIQ
ncbi:MAG: hypothetical protein EOM37_12190 [Proteobacteria bacterium]|nr:hypothetical protein [Pseudomonadota bacterium]